LSSQDRRPLPDTALATLPLFAAAHAAVWLTRLPAVLDTGPSPTDPPWLTRLRTRLETHARVQRATLLAWTASTRH